MGTYCISCKNKKCVNYNKPITFSWDCEKYFNNDRTNADLIRSMTDEELAMWLVNFFWGNKKDVRLFNMLEWLRESAEEC